MYIDKKKWKKLSNCNVFFSHSIVPKLEHEHVHEIQIHSGTPVIYCIYNIVCI